MDLMSVNSGYIGSSPGMDVALGKYKATHFCLKKKDKRFSLVKLGHAGTQKI